MSGASAHKSRTRRQARRLAADLAKGRMPATLDLEDYLDRFPDDDVLVTASSNRSPPVVPVMLLRSVTCISSRASLSACVSAASEATKTPLG